MGLKRVHGKTTPGCGEHPHVVDDKGKAVIDGEWYGAVDEGYVALFTAAPDLLEACRALLAETNGYDLSPEEAERLEVAIKLAESAIAKATGGAN